MFKNTFAKIKEKLHRIKFKKYIQKFKRKKESL